jgi:hypothetical protein
MSWRQFKREPEGFKGSKGFKSQETTGTTIIKPLRPLKPVRVITEISTQDATQADMQRLVGESLDAVDREGRPWPARFVANMPTENRKRLRALERDIDAAVLNADKATLPVLLIEWRALLLQHLH